MLINVNPLLSPDILATLRSMGHGDRFVLSDANFPSFSHTDNLLISSDVIIPKHTSLISDSKTP